MYRNKHISRLYAASAEAGFVLSLSLPLSLSLFLSLFLSLSLLHTHTHLKGERARARVCGYCTHLCILGMRVCVCVRVSGSSVQRGDLILTFEVKYPKSLPEHVRKKLKTELSGL